MKRGLTGAIRVATQAGRRLLRLLAGEPYLTPGPHGRWIVTRFSIDQDAVSICHPGLDEATTAKHFSLIHEENRSLEQVLRLGVRVLEIAASVAPPLVYWKAARLALEIFHAVFGSPSERRLAVSPTRGRGLAVAAVPVAAADRDYTLWLTA